MITVTQNGKPVQVSLVADLTDGNRVTYQVAGELVVGYLDYYNDVAAWHCYAESRPGYGMINDDVNAPCPHIHAAQLVRGQQEREEGCIRWHNLAVQVNARAVERGVATAEEVAPTAHVLTAVAAAAAWLLDLLHTAADDALLANLVAGDEAQAAAYDLLAANAGYDPADLYACA